MAHEFGHAIQGRTGLLISGTPCPQNSDSKSASLESIRRLETQADCFAGMFIRSVSQSLGYAAAPTWRASEHVRRGRRRHLDRQDPNVEGNHGLAARRKYWGVTGLGNSPVSACNTFTAPPSLVR